MLYGDRSINVQKNGNDDHYLILMKMNNFKINLNLDLLFQFLVI